MPPSPLDPIPWSLIGASLSGQSSPEEEADLKQWRETKSENEARFQEAERLWALTGQIGPQASFDSQADWPKVARMAGIPQPGKMVRLPWHQHNLVRIAAAVVLLVGVGLILRWWAAAPAPEWQQVIAEGQSVFVSLPDGSEIALREGSSLRYPIPFPAKQRPVFLEGEAWFEVVKDSLRPFRIQGPSLKVEVLGTSFAIRDLRTETTAQVDVASGLVRVAAQDSLLLAAGESGQLLAGNLTSVPQSPHFLAWRQQELRFDNAPLSEVLPALSRYYEREFHLTEDKPDARLTARFQEESLAEALQVLEISLGLSFDTTRQTILLSP